MMERTRYNHGAYDVFLLGKVATTTIPLLMARSVMLKTARARRNKRETTSVYLHGDMLIRLGRELRGDLLSRS